MDCVTQDRNPYSVWKKKTYDRPHKKVKKKVRPNCQFGLKKKKTGRPNPTFGLCGFWKKKKQSCWFSKNIFINYGL